MEGFTLPDGVNDFGLSDDGLAGIREIFLGTPGIYHFYGSANNGKSTFLKNIILPNKKCVSGSIPHLLDMSSQEAEVLYTELEDDPLTPHKGKIDLVHPYIVLSNKPLPDRFLTSFVESTPMTVITFPITFTSFNP